MSLFSFYIIGINILFIGGKITKNYFKHKTFCLKNEQKEKISQFIAVLDGKYYGDNEYKVKTQTEFCEGTILFAFSK